MKKQIVIKYIYHSGFSINIGNQILIFDYHDGELTDLNPEYKDITFLVTHGHGDHFNRSILELPKSKYYRYIMSSDVPELLRKDNVIYLGKDQTGVEEMKLFFRDNIHYMKPGEFSEYDNLMVRTFGSTDRGVSYLVEAEGINIFHAGDLNLWLWDSDTESEKQKMRQDFMAEIKEIKKYAVDIAFFPLDPRLKGHYSDGFRIFLDEVKPSLIFPMHFREDVSYNISFMSEYEKYKEVYRPIIKRNQVFMVNYE